MQHAACNLSTSTCGRKGGWCRRGRGWGFRHGVEGSQLTQAGESSPDAAVCRRGSVAPSTPALKQSPGRVRRGTSTRSGSHGELIPWGSSRGRTFAPPPCCQAQCARPTRLPGPGETPRQRLVRPSARMGHLAALVHHGPTGKKPQCFERGMETQAPHLDACQCSPRAFNGADFPFLGYVTRGTECSLRQSERALPAGTLVGALKTLASRCTAHRCPATGARTGEHL